MFAFVSGKIVEDNDVTLLQGRCQLFFDIDIKRGPVHSPVLFNQFDEKRPVGIKLALATRATLHVRFVGSKDPNALRWPVKASGATLPRARLTLLQSTSETAPELLLAKMLT